MAKLICQAKVNAVEQHSRLTVYSPTSQMCVVGFSRQIQCDEPRQTF